jgi:putative oxidoreductase
MENLPTLDQLNFGLLVLRLVIGPVFAFHGFAKIYRGGGLEGTAGWFDSIGVLPGHVHARLAAGGELLTGICLTLGLFTSFAGMGMVGLMAVAFWVVHKGQGLLITQGGWEYVVVLASVGVAFAVIGAGEWSLDNAIGIDLNGPAGFIIALVGGLGLAAALVATSHHPAAPEPAVAPDSAEADTTDV